MQVKRNWLIFPAFLVIAFATISMNQIGYPFRGPLVNSSSGKIETDRERLIVVLTTAKVSPGEGRNFMSHLNAVMGSMPDRAGLVGYAVRKQIVGRNVWTQSVWESEDALKVFLQSDKHQRAVREGGVERASFNSVTIELSPDEVPLPWSQVKRLTKEVR